jgi:hypothetical protein
MLLPLFASLVIFFGTVFGLAWPVAARLALDPAEKLCASALLSLLFIYLFAFAVYTLDAPVAALWALPLLALAGPLLGRRALIAAILDPDARSLLTGQLLVAGWCVGWLFFIASYSGGGWAGDWFEHWERARFFLERSPLDTKFLGSYALPARPPLANLVTGAFLAVTQISYAHYQLVTALLNSLAFLPAALLARRFGGGRRAMAVLAVLLMVSPSFVENATFAWTKLIAVAFVLGGLYFFLRTRDANPPRAAGPLCAAFLAAGILTHYSAAPFALLLAAAWLLWQRPPWRTTVWLALLAAAVLATWFGWSLANYGPQTTLFSNSTVTSKDAQQGNQLLKIALNLRDTVVPHFLRSVDPALIAQRSPWGWWRDWFFQLYQVNLLFVFGSVAWLAIIVELVRRWRARSSAGVPPALTPRQAGTPALLGRGFWLWFIGGSILLGVAAHGARDSWGLAHICLQSIVVLGLAFLAARWSRLARGWRLALIAGATADLMLGIALQFGAQSYALDRWLAPGRDSSDTLTSYSESALLNLGGKIRNHLAFFTDVFPVPLALVLALLATVLMLALVRVHAASSEP